MISLGWLKALAARDRYQRALAWLPPLILSVFVGASLWHSYSEELSQAEAKALTLARAVEQHATATFDRSSLALSAAIQRIQPSDLNRDTLPKERQQVLNNILTVQHQQTRGIVSMSLTDANGIVLANSVGVAPGVDLSDRKYFQQLKSGSFVDVVISEVMKGKVSNRWGLQLARRINLPDGSFGGMVVANLGLYENFESFYQGLNAGSKGLIALRSQDSTLLVRYPVVESALGKTVQPSGVTQALNSQVTETVVRSISPIDRIDRITTVRKLPDYPIYTLVGIAYDEAVLSWLRESAALIFLSLIMLLLMVLVSAMAQHRFEMIQKLRMTELSLAQERDARHTLLKQEVADRTAELQQANRQLENFLFAASHDLRGPLGRISSFCTLLDKNHRDSLDGEGLRYLDFIRDNALRLTKLIDDLLDHARVDNKTYHLLPTNIQLAVYEVLKNKNEEIRQSGAVIRLEVPATLVVADVDSLDDVLDSLLENALKYSAESAPPVIDIGGEEVEGRFRLWVKDNGIGFGSECHDKVFQIFRRLHTSADYAGNGAGLALVKRAMERMGGKVWAEGEPGQGATFYLEFDLAPQHMEFRIAG